MDVRPRRRWDKGSTHRLEVGLGGGGGVELAREVCLGVTEALRRGLEELSCPMSIEREKGTVKKENYFDRSILFL